jgi:hypothetical protein
MSHDSTRHNIDPSGTHPSSTHHGTTADLELLACPGCGAPAEVVDRFVLPSTDGPVEHLKIGCVTRHWFTVAADRLPGGPGATRPGEEPDRWTRPPC